MGAVREIKPYAFSEMPFAVATLFFHIFLFEVCQIANSKNTQNHESKDYYSSPEHLSVQFVAIVYIFRESPEVLLTALAYLALSV